MNKQKIVIYFKKVGSIYEKRAKTYLRDVNDAWFEVSDERAGKDYTKQQAIDIQESRKTKLKALKIRGKADIDAKIDDEITEIDSDLTKLKS